MNLRKLRQNLHCQFGSRAQGIRFQQLISPLNASKWQVSKGVLFRSFYINEILMGIWMVINNININININIYIYIIFLCFMLVSSAMTAMRWETARDKATNNGGPSIHVRPLFLKVLIMSLYIFIRILILSVHSWHNILQTYIQVVDLTHITPLKAHLVWQALSKTLGTSRRWSHITSIVFCND